MPGEFDNSREGTCFFFFKVMGQIRIALRKFVAVVGINVMDNPGTDFLQNSLYMMWIDTTGCFTASSQQYNFDSTWLEKTSKLAYRIWCWCRCPIVHMNQTVDKQGTLDQINGLCRKFQRKLDFEIRLRMQRPGGQRPGVQRPASQRPAQQP